MDQVGVNGAKYEEKWGPESVLKRETSSVNGDIIVITRTARISTYTGTGSCTYALGCSMTDDCSRYTYISRSA
jgi:hypothetical protein